MSAAPGPSSPVTAVTVGASEIEKVVATELDAFQREDVTHKLVGLVVHGMGEQPVGSVLKGITNEFFRLIRHISHDPGIAATPLDEGDPHQVKIWFTDEKTQNKYEIRFLEVWWKDAFDPPSVGQFIATSFKMIAATLTRAGKKRWQFLAPWREWGPALWQRLLVELLVPFSRVPGSGVREA